MGTMKYYCLAALKKPVSFIKLLYIAEFYHFSRFSAPIACNKELRNLRRLSASGRSKQDEPVARMDVEIDAIGRGHQMIRRLVL